MSVFGPPVLLRVDKARPVLDGGRTRLQVVVRGWGRLTLSHLSADGVVDRRRLWLRGGERGLLVDVTPPCDLTVDVRNPFGGESRSLVVRADLPGIVDLPAPQVAPLPEPQALAPPMLRPLPVYPVRLPDAPCPGTPRLRLGTITIKTISDPVSVEGER